MSQSFSAIFNDFLAKASVAIHELSAATDSMRGVLNIPVISVERDYEEKAPESEEPEVESVQEKHRKRKATKNDEENNNDKATDAQKEKKKREKKEKSTEPVIIPSDNTIDEILIDLAKHSRKVGSENFMRNARKQTKISREEIAKRLDRLQAEGKIEKHEE